MSDAPRPRCDLDEMEARARAVCKDHREYSNSDYDAFVQAADATTVLELVRRLREAEGIVKSLALSIPDAEETDDDGKKHVFCAVCDAEITSAWPSLDEHREDCAYRRAVAATRRES